MKALRWSKGLGAEAIPENASDAPLLLAHGGLFFDNGGEDDELMEAVSFGFKRAQCLGLFLEDLRGPHAKRTDHPAHDALGVGITQQLVGIGKEVALCSRLLEPDALEEGSIFGCADKILGARRTKRFKTSSDIESVQPFGNRHANAEISETLEDPHRKIGRREIVMENDIDGFGAGLGASDPEPERKSEGRIDEAVFIEALSDDAMIFLAGPFETNACAFTRPLRVRVDGEKVDETEERAERQNEDEGC